MRGYSEAAMEKAMNRQEVMLPAMAGQIIWTRAAEIVGCSERHLRRMCTGYEKFSFIRILKLYYSWRKRGTKSIMETGT